MQTTTFVGAARFGIPRPAALCPNSSAKWRCVQRSHWSGEGGAVTQAVPLAHGDIVTTVNWMSAITSCRA